MYNIISNNCSFNNIKESDKYNNVLSNEYSDTDEDVLEENDDVQEENKTKIEQNKDWVYNLEYEYEVTEESFTLKSGEVYSINDIVLPYININSDDAKKVNDEIKELYIKILKFYESEYNGNRTDYKKTSYKIIKNLNVLSIVITVKNSSDNTDIYDYYTYNFNLDTLNRMTYEEIYKMAEFSDNNINSIIKKYIEDYAEFNDYSNKGNMKEYKEKSIINYEQSVQSNTIQYYLDPNMCLNIVVKLELPAEVKDLNRIIAIR